MASATSADPFIGKVLDGRFEILSRLGEGGMGVVYKARQVTIDRVIALKMLNAHIASDPNWVQRFYNEAKASSRLQHPNTVRMFDFGQTSDGRLFMTMEYLDGIGLRQAIARDAPFSPQRVVKVLIQCCASLAEAHSIGIIHRDIKPDNVFLLNMPGSPDFVKLLDFSVAKLMQEADRMRTQAGVVFGTPQYMSPEQGRGLPLDPRSDIYGLGVLAFEMLTGRVPYHDDNPMHVLQMHQRAEIPPLPASLPPSVQQIVRRALDKEPGGRFQSAGEMMQRCQQVFAELSGGASIGAAGVPKAITGPGFGPALSGPPAMGPPAGAPPAGAPSAMGPPAMGGQPPGNPYGVQLASPAQRTMMIEPGAYRAPAPMPVPVPVPVGGVDAQARTVMLQPSEGVFSVARQGAPVLAMGLDDGASPLYWLACIAGGIAAGALAYVVVLQL